MLGEKELTRAAVRIVRGSIMAGNVMYSVRLLSESEERAGGNAIEIDGFDFGRTFRCTTGHVIDVLFFRKEIPALARWNDVVPRSASPSLD